MELNDPVHPRVGSQTMIKRAQNELDKVVNIGPIRECKVDNGSAPKVKETVEKEQPNVPPPPYKPSIPYPRRLSKSKTEG